MSLIKCSECGKEISDKAKTCIHCGNPIYKEKVQTMKKKKLEELTQEEKDKICSYRKLKKEWWNVPGRSIGFILCMISLLFLLLGFMLRLNSTLIIVGVIFSILGCVLVASASNESKTWYEKNVDRLYEDEVLK